MTSRPRGCTFITNFPIGEITSLRITDTFTETLIDFCVHHEEVRVYLLGKLFCDIMFPISSHVSKFVLSLQAPIYSNFSYKSCTTSLNISSCLRHLSSQSNVYSHIRAINYSSFLTGKHVRSVQSGPQCICSWSSLHNYMIRGGA